MREPDQYKVAALQGGLPVCTFSPRPYARAITNIVVTNGIPSTVEVYRGSLSSVAVARNTKGDSNTLQGRIEIGAGQLFFVRWTLAPVDITTATARVSFDRLDTPFEGGDQTNWSENPQDRIIVPSTGPALGDPYVDIGNAIRPDGTVDLNFAGIAWYSPASLPDGYAYIIRITAIDPDTTLFVIQLYDHNNPGSPVKSILSAEYTASTNRQELSIGNDTDEIQIGSSAPDVVIGSGAAFNSLFIGSAGNSTIFKIDNKTISFSGGGVNDTTLADTETNAAFQPIVGMATKTYQKHRSATRTIAWMSLSWFTTAVNTGADIGLRFDDGAGTVIDVLIAKEQKTLANTRSGHTCGVVEIPNATVGQDIWTVSGVYRRFVGAGTLTVDANDSGSFFVMEFVEA